MNAPFEEMTLDEQLERLRLLADEALAHYDLKDPTVRLLQYEDNAVYLIEADGRRHVLRMSVTDGRSPTAQASELEWMEALTSERSVLVPAPVSTRSAEKVVVMDLPGWQEPVTSVLLEWVPGEASPDCLRTNMARDLGRATAQLHEHASSYRPSAGFTRPSWGHREVFALGAALADPLAEARLGTTDRTVLREVCEVVRDRMPTRAEGEWGLIHADLHRGNVVGTPGGGVAVIDFDDCGWGYYMLDVATVLSSILRACLDDREAYARLAEDYVEGYRSVWELPLSAMSLNEFLVMRDMIILNFMLGSRNAKVLGYAPKRANGILQLMRRYLETGTYDGHVSLAT